jgi:hypothetical protein
MREKRRLPIGDGLRVSLVHSDEVTRVGNFKQVRNVEYRGKYVYHILFDGAVEGDLDFSEYLSKEPILEALKDTSLFAKATVEGGTIAWPNGAGVAPETLYAKMLRANKPKLSKTARL